MPIVRAGSRIAGLAPLLPVRAWTVEGRERFGGARPTGGAGVWGGGYSPGLMGTNLVARNSRVNASRPRLAASRRGLGATFLSADPNGAAYGNGQIQMKNLRTGQVIGNYQRGSFQVGDPWQISISSEHPNYDVWLSTSLGSYPLPMAGQLDVPWSIWLGIPPTSATGPVGKTDSSGKYSTSGVFKGSQAGKWHQSWGIGEALWMLDFDVADASGVVPNVGAGADIGIPNYMLATPHVPAQTYTQEQLAQMAQVPEGGIPQWAKDLIKAKTATGSPAAGTAAATAGSTERTAQEATGGGPSFDVGGFLQGSALGGIPNWMLLAGGLAAVLIVPRLLK